jgi:hypothetical protein
MPDRGTPILVPLTSEDPEFPKFRIARASGCDTQTILITADPVVKKSWRTRGKPGRRRESGTHPFVRHGPRRFTPELDTREQRALPVLVFPLGARLSRLRDRAIPRGQRTIPS